MTGERNPLFAGQYGDERCPYDYPRYRHDRCYRYHSFDDDGSVSVEPLFEYPAPLDVKDPDAAGA